MKRSGGLWLIFALLLVLMIWQRYPTPTQDVEPAPSPSGVAATDGHNDRPSTATAGLQRSIEAQLLEAELLGREDLLRAKLQRLKAVNPGAPLLDVYGVWLALRATDETAARAHLAALQSREGDSLLSRQLADYLSAHTDNRASLLQTRLLAKTGREQEAAAQFEALYKHGIALRASELEYLRVVARIDGRRNEVIRRLRELNEQYPQLPPLQLELADQLLAADPASVEARQLLGGLFRDPALATQAAERWLSALARQPFSAARLAEHAMLAEQFPENIALQDAWQRARLDDAEQRRLMRDPFYRARSVGIALLESGDLAKAERKLRYALIGRPRDTEVLGGLGLLYMRRGEHARAQRYFKDAQRYNRDPDQQSRWQSLIDTARFWQALRRGEALLEAGRYPAAKRALAEAQTLDKSALEPLLRLAEIARRQADPAGAERYFQQVLQRDSLNVDALWGRIQLARESGGERAAERQYERYSLAQRRQLMELRRAYQSQTLAAQLRAATAAGRREDMAAIVEQLLSVKPRSPWLQSEVAQAMAALGEVGRADRYMADAARADSSDDMAFAHALYLSGRGQRREAIALLQSIPAGQRSASMQANLQRLQFDEASSELASSDAERRKQLRELAQRFGDDPVARLRIARLWLDAGDQAAARQLLQAYQPLAKQPAAQQLAVARLWLDMADFGAFEQWFRPAVVRVDAGTSDLSREDLAAVGVDYQLAQGRHYQQLGKPLLARGQFRRVASQAVQQRGEALLALMQLSGECDDEDSFVHYSERLLAQADELSGEQLLRAAVLQGLYQQPQHQRRSLSLLRTRPSLSDQQWRAAMLQAVAAGDWQNAERYGYAALQRADNQPDLDLSLSEAQRRQLYRRADRNYWLTSNVLSVLDQARERRSGHIKVGIDLSQRRAGSGLRQLPMELRWPFRDYAGHLLLRIDRVAVDSGSVAYLDPDGNIPPGLNRIAFDERRQGTAVGIGWQAQRWQADIGTTPIGFKKRGLVGGLSLRGDLGQVGWSATLSRRPETGTALSYAGMTVPDGAAFAGRDWGGVLSSGLKVGLSYDRGAEYGFWSSLQYHQLAGDTVADNSRQALLGGVYRRLVAEDTRNLRIGLNAMLLAYDKNLSEYSLGHGAYYSPQQYLSLSVPVRYYGRVGDNWSYLLAASVSHSWSDEDPLYRLGEGGGAGGGFGYSLEAAVERRLSRHWYLGLAADIERADFYEPNHLSLYVKYQFDDRWQAIYSPPQPPIPYSDFD